MTSFPRFFRFVAIAHLSLLCLVGAVMVTTTAAAAEPLKVGVVGLTHGHVKGFLRRAAAAEQVQLVGVAEADPALAAEYAESFGFAPAIVYPDVASMLKSAKPEAVVVYTQTSDYPEIVKACAQQGVHVMLEKPLAISLAKAREIEAAAKSGKIQVLVNYETNWMPSLAAAHSMIFDQEAIGQVRKIEVQIGHQGPIAIGSTPPQFVDWLGDPAAGGGTLLDFGSYAVCITSWLLDGERPKSVYCLNQQLQPADYADVEDETTIILAYDEAVAILQGSWNSPTDRKDVQVYGEYGYVKTLQQKQIELMVEGMDPETMPADEPEAPEQDQIAYLFAVVRNGLAPEGRPALQHNLLVMEILEAAMESAKTGKAITLP
ncbi:MAG: Gfo/Idh/MocA family protein [Verrucomicrobiota bacterium]|jgi:predicted dehydrogenase|nr:Gfo/Idh/MocA family oxidoreductase [Verrucomicrobiota bacterium]